MKPKFDFKEAVIGRIIPAPRKELRTRRGFRFFAEPKDRPGLRMESKNLDDLVYKCAEVHLFAENVQLSPSEKRDVGGYVIYPVDEAEITYFRNFYVDLYNHVGYPSSK